MAIPSLKHRFIDIGRNGDSFPSRGRITRSWFCRSRSLLASHLQTSPDPNVERAILHGWCLYRRQQFFNRTKVGIWIYAGVVGASLDVTYFIDQNYGPENKDRNAWVTTPKIGISILGFADLFYGYEIPLSSERITSITKTDFHWFLISIGITSTWKKLLESGNIIFNRTFFNCRNPAWFRKLYLIWDCQKAGAPTT